MSFQVRAGTSPQQHHGSTQPSSVSPSLSYRGGHHGSNPPPFTLAESAMGSANNSTTEIPSSGGSKRIGTDPSKYKTTICRNWEQTGSCSFRGCTFAHGVDDLRPPIRANASPPLPPQQSPASTPPMYAQEQRQQQQQQSSNGTLKIEQLLEMLVIEIQRERDLTGVHLEANKTLESMLRREQSQVGDLQSKVEALQNQAMELARQVKERNAELLNLLQIAGPAVSTEHRLRVESLASWHFVNSAGSSSSHMVDRHHADAASSGADGFVPSSRRVPTSTAEGSSNGLRPAAPVWVPPSAATPSENEVGLGLGVSSPTSETKHLRELLEQLRK